MTEGVIAGNPSIPLLALLLSSHHVLAAVAPLVKAYTGMALLAERRWRAIAISLAAGIATIAFAPSLWVGYLLNLLTRSERLITEASGGFSGSSQPLLLVGATIAVVLIATRDRRMAGWLAAPALWPAAQFHWWTLAMPVMHPVLAVSLLFPFQGMAVVGLMATAIAVVFTQAPSPRSRLPFSLANVLRLPLPLRRNELREVQHGVQREEAT